jgi:hypothetical protein
VGVGGSSYLHKFFLFSINSNHTHILVEKPFQHVRLPETKTSGEKMMLQMLNLVKKQNLTIAICQIAWAELTIVNNVGKQTW